MGVGGFLADYVFEPFMRRENAVTQVLQIILTAFDSVQEVYFLLKEALGTING